MSAIEIDTQVIDEDEDGAIRLGDIYIPPPYKTPDNNGRKTLMMVKIINNNFKSFYGEVALGPFHQNFTAIIGPNGSGKSNVIDSLMFVFGSRANKIRSKKLSALIHDSALHKNIDSCSVSIHYKQIIRNQNGYEDVPGSDVIVSRTIFKDNTGFYKLNNEKVQFKVIFSLFKGLGIDLNHNRFLILQGEVEQIALMKCKGRNENDIGMLEYLEDIIGTSRYNIALKKLHAKVEELELNKSSKDSDVQIVRKELEDCKAPRDNAIEFYVTENQIALKRYIISQKKISIVEKLCNKTKEKQNTCSSSINEAKRKLEENLSNKNKLESEANAFKKEMNSIVTLISKLDEKFDKLNREDNEKTEESKSINGNRKKMMKKLQDLKIDLEKLLATPTNYASEIVECENKIKSLKNQYEKATEALEESKKKIGQVSNKLLEEQSNLQKKLKPEKAKLNIISEEYNKLSYSLKMSVSKNEQLENNIKNKKSRLEQAQIQLNERNLLIANLEATIQSSEREYQALKLELEDIVRQEQVNEKELERNKRILNELEDIDINRSRGHVLDFLVQKRKQGLLDGLFGRLGDLGGINNKYDIAISTACGALDYILVDNISTAQKCIELLKQYNIGRATFIALDKQQHFWGEIKLKFDSPENLPRLFDLVNVQDTRILPGLFFVTRNTLVANDLEQAARVAYGRKRHRVVTLKGELIELTGTLSGGGSNPRRGLMGNKVSEKTMSGSTSKYKLEDIQNERRKLEETKRNIDQTKENCIERLNIVKHALSKDKFQLIDINRVVKPISEECRQLTEELKAIQMQDSNEEISSLQSLVDIKKAELDKQQVVVENIEVVLNEVKEKINCSVMGSVKHEQTKVNKLKADISKFQNQIIKLNVATTNNEKKVKIIKEQISNTEENIEKCKSQIINLQSEKKTIEEIAESVLKQKEENEDKSKEVKESYRTAIANMKGVNKMNSELKEELMELENKLSEIQKKADLYSKELASYKSEMLALKLNDTTLTNENPDSFKILTAEELEEINVGELKNQINEAREKIKQKKLEPNTTAITMYNTSAAKHEAALEALSVVSQELVKVKELLEELEGRRLHEFMTGFGFIAMKCREFYRMLSLDGDADLDLVDSSNPFTKGIILNIRPPKKSWRSILQLSGGEKTLSSLAFVFAVHHFRPSPMYLMDEIDAALDTRNVTIVGHLIQYLSACTQFIVISLSESMFKLSDRLVGIYKVDDCTGTIVMRNNNEIYNRPNYKPPPWIRFRYEDEEGNLKEIRMKDDEIFEVLIRKKTDTSDDVEAGCSASPPKKAKT